MLTGGVGIEVEGAENFTQFWKPEFDLDSVTIGDILVDLKVASNLVSAVENWFVAFYVNGGIDLILGYDITYSIQGSSSTTNITAGTGADGNLILIPVPDNVESIVQWITGNFQSEIQSLLSQYNVTFASGSNAPITVPNPSTGFSASNYVMPSGCSYTSDLKDTIRCSAGNARGVTFTFDQINQYLAASAATVCTSSTQVVQQCKANTVITDFNTCVKLAAFNKFQLSRTTVLYGILSYDSVLRNSIFSKCQAQNENYAVTSADFSAAFTFNFPNIN